MSISNVNSRIWNSIKHKVHFKSEGKNGSHKEHLRSQSISFKVSSMLSVTASGCIEPDESTDTEVVKGINPATGEPFYSNYEVVETPAIEATPEHEVNWLDKNSGLEYGAIKSEKKLI